MLAELRLPRAGSVTYIANNYFYFRFIGILERIPANWEFKEDRVHALQAGRVVLLVTVYGGVVPGAKRVATARPVTATRANRLQIRSRRRREENPPAKGFSSRPDAACPGTQIGSGEILRDRRSSCRE